MIQMMTKTDSRSHRRISMWNCLIFLCLLFLSCKNKPANEDISYLKPLQKLTPDAFMLVFLSSIEGYVEPCGCTSNPLGGIARFATVFKNTTNVLKKNIAIIDCGNLLFETKQRSDLDLCQDNERIDLLLSTMKGLGLDFTTPGILDKARGVEFLNQKYKKYGISYLADFVDINNSPHNITIIKTPSYNIGLVAIHKPAPANLTALEIIKAAPVKFRVVISHLDSEETKHLFRDLNYVDAVIQGNVASFTQKTPEKLGNKGPYYFEVGRQGQHFTAFLLQNLAKRGDEAIKYDDSATKKRAREELLVSRIAALEKQWESQERRDFISQRLKVFKEELDNLRKEDNATIPNTPTMSFINIPLTKKIPADNRAQNALDSYEKSLPRLAKKCEENVLCPSAEKDAPTYVGVNACKTCHIEAVNVWEKAVFLDKSLNDKGQEITRSIGHSKAWQTLVSAGKDSDRSCIGCHSIGFMEKGGYCKASDVDFRKGVQCEACHGPGSLHAKTADKRFIKRKVSEQTCRNCHQVPHILTDDSFNYDEKVIKILGKGHGEALLKEITHRLKSKQNNAGL